MDEILGSIIFEYIGAFIKWVYYTLKNWLLGKEHISFGTIYSGKENDKFHDQFFLGVSNIFLGLIFCLGVIVILIKFGL